MSIGLLNGSYGRNPGSGLSKHGDPFI
jgi:hypothetical protein